MKLIKKLKSLIVLWIIKLIYRKRINIGNKLGIRKGFNIIIGKNAKVTIGNGVFFNNYCSVNSLGEIMIGDDCIFGEGVKIYDHNHLYKSTENIKQQGFSIGQVKIGNNCWIGSNVTILNNVSIGNNVVVGANCLIYKSIPDNCIVKNGNSLIIDTIECSK